MLVLAARRDRLRTSVEISDETGIAAPMVSKILKMLTRADMVDSVRGAHGGHRLLRPVGDVSIAEIIEVLDGPIALTGCADDGDQSCNLLEICQARPSWTKINSAIRQALDGVTLADMADDMNKWWQDGLTSPPNDVHLVKQTTQ